MPWLLHNIAIKTFELIELNLFPPPSLLLYVSIYIFVMREREKGGRERKRERERERERERGMVQDEKVYIKTL